VQPYRDIALLAETQFLCFLFLAQFEPRFVVIHLYQSVLYLAILILLYYREDRWAYMIAMLGSAVWLVLAYVSPLLSVAVRRLVAFRTSDTTQIAVSVLAPRHRVHRAVQDRPLRSSLAKGVWGSGKNSEYISNRIRDRDGLLRGLPSLVLAMIPDAQEKADGSWTSSSSSHLAAGSQLPVC
jgi:hypothetical protein